MEPTLFYVGLYFLVSLLQLASSRVDNYNGWKNSPNVQYHIQTDEGEERYFKYQTKSGQYRKEKRLQDGTVVGTYGWVDPNGYLRLRDYIADNQGYRILKTKMIYVGGNSISGDSGSGTFHSKYSPLPSVTFHLDNQAHRFNPYVLPTPNTYVSSSPTSYAPSTSNTYSPSSSNTYPSYSPNTYGSSSPNSYIPPTQSSYLPPYYSQSTYGSTYPSTTPSPSTHLSSPSSVSPLVSYPSFYPSSSTPLVEVSPNSIPKFSTHEYASSTASPSVAIYSDPTPKPIAVYASTPKPIAVNYVTTPRPEISSPSSAYSSTPSTAYSSTPSPIEHTTAHAIPAIGIASSTTPPPPLPPVAGKFAYFDRNNNFITETEKNKLFFQNEDKNYYGSYNNEANNYFSDESKNYYSSNRYADYKNDYQEYDGIATVQNGFRYYLPKHYHEEQTSNDGQERTGSFGYIDPFGIRRVIYYNTAPGRGFLHRKNNRYVGFNSTPYDPRPPF